MFSLPTRLGGLGLKIFTEVTENEYKDLNLQAQILETNSSECKATDETKTECGKRNQEKLRQFLATSDEKSQKNDENS